MAAKQITYAEDARGAILRGVNQLVKVFLDETRITGIRTEVDETTRVLVAASAIIPVFNFDNWEYSRLGEVLIYPGSFDPITFGHIDIIKRAIKDIRIRERVV